MIISCDGCVMQRSAACADCLVTHVLGADGELESDAAVERAIRLLVNAGLVPAAREPVAC
jgi:hypothetical protein